MIAVGTCSWAEQTLVRSGEFYPKEAKTAESRLRYYALSFCTVEVDSTYYAMPSPHMASLWAERTPDDFVFHIKAYGALTGHGIDPKTLPRDLAKTFSAEDRLKGHVYVRDPGLLREIAGSLKAALAPLSEKGKLGMLVFQFPPWFHYRTENLDQIVARKDLMEPLPIAVEFRHGSWLAPARAGSVFRFLREQGITYVTADEPQFGSLATVPFLPEVTTDVAYFRFHGRNRENWLRKGIETALRYNYQYADEELREFVGPLRAAASRASRAYAMFNNCYMASAIKSALRMEKLLREEKGSGSGP